MTTNCLAAAATIFSLSSAPPPPFTRLRGIDLVGSIDGDIDRPGIVGLDEGNAGLSRKRGSIVGGRHGVDLQPRTHAFTKCHNQVFRGRAGAKPDDHAVADIVSRFQRRLPLLEVEIGLWRHDGMDSASCAATDAAPSSAVLSLVTTFTGIWFINRL